MAKVKAPKLFLGNYVKFSLEKLIERHSARGEWKYIPYINDYKNLFVEMPNGDILDYSTNKKIDVFPFEDIDNLSISKETNGVTNLVPVSKFYSDINVFLSNTDLVLTLINHRLEQSDSWIKKEHLTLENTGLFSYSGELTENQKIIMTLDDNINFALNNKENLSNEGIDINDELYIGFLVEREMDVYFTDDTELIDDSYLAKDVLCNMLPKVKILKKKEDKYIDIKNDCIIKEINDEDLKYYKENGYNFLAGISSEFYISETIGVCNITKLSVFLNNLGASINPEEDIESQMNEYYSDLGKFYMYDKISPIKYPEIKSILKRSIVINKKVN